MSPNFFPDVFPTCFLSLASITSHIKHIGEDGENWAIFYIFSSH